MKHWKIIVIGILAGVIFLGVSVAPAFANGNWWNAFVDVKSTAKLDLYKGSYWATILRPGYLKCESASLTIGNVVYIGSVRAYWWRFRSCDVTFEDIPANSTGTLTVNYVANGSRSYQKAISVGKTWLNTWRVPPIILPWYEDYPN